jgi:hypothetical protein
MTEWWSTRTMAATRPIIAVSMALILLGAFTAAALAVTRVYVGPPTGHPSTHFLIRFGAPERTGRLGTIRRTDHLYVTGPTGSGCTSRVRGTLPPVRRGERVRITLRPASTKGWCPGSFRARIVRTESVICSGTCAGPALPLPRTIARFSFKVVKPATGSTPTPIPTPAPTSGPTFAGVKSATMCQSGTAKVVLPPSRSYTVSWDAATDPSTPSDKIVYDVYYSPTSGGENFSSAVATTGPGQTSHSGKLPGSGAAYFVVRARDTAGHEDTNTVEKQAVNTC